MLRTESGVPMTGNCTTNLLRSVTRLFLALVFVVTFPGCSKESQDAVVIGKEHIPAHVEGTEYKEREMDHEQWWVDVRMKSGLRANAPVDEAQWNALKPGDRVRAKYAEGKYTGTVWAIDIQKE